MEDLRNNSVAAVRTQHCPTCIAPFDWVELRDLRAVSVAWRCPPGAAPRSFAVTCRACRQTCVAHVARDHVGLDAGEPAAAMLRDAHKRERDDAAERIARRYDRGRDRDRR